MGFNDDDNNFTDTLNVELTNGQLKDVVSTAIHKSYQSGIINGNRPPFVGRLWLRWAIEGE